MSQPVTSPRSQFLTRQRIEQFTGVVLALVCLGVGAVTLIAIDVVYISRWLWAVLLIICVAATFYSAEGRRPVHRLSYVLGVVSSWALFVTIDHQGMISVLMVVAAAVGCYVVPMWAVSLVVVANNALILVFMLVHDLEPLDAVAVTFFYAFIHLLAFLSTFEIIQESRLRALLEQRNVQLTAAGVMLEDSARNSERLRISRELHDLIGHQLTVLNLELEAARHRNTQGDAFACAEHIDQAATVAKDLLGDVRGTVSELRNTEPGDVADALERMAAAVPSLDVHIRVGRDVHPEDDLATTLIRAAQEIMTNTVRHSEATSLWIDAARDNGEIRLTGHDNGPTTTAFAPGNGLRGLQERVEIMGGSMDVSTRDGFTVEIRLPERAHTTVAPGVRPRVDPAQEGSR